MPIKYSAVNAYQIVELKEFSILYKIKNFISFF